MAGGRVREAQAAAPTAGARIDIKKSVCTHCSVGCTIMAEVQNGVWIGQEPGFDSPLNLGAHCAKGAAAREHAHGDRRLKYPMKLVGGKWTRISWDVAINEIGDKMLDIRQKSGQDAVYFLGSAKFSNEQAYLFRKFYAFWGSNNGDHQARICHSTTVAGVANTWGYGAMTNSYNDIQKSKAIFLIGGNPAEAHPVSVQFLLKCKEQNNAPLIVCDPRFTRTAAHATEYVRFRPGTDIALIWGILWHIFENGWEDKEFIRKRVWGMDFVREEVGKWTPEETEKVTGVPGAQLRRVAKTLATNKPGTVIWCMGGTQHTVGNANVRAYCILQLALGNMGTAGGGTNIFRGHDNVQGATDFGVEPGTLPGYYGLAEGAWKHWSRVWDVPYDHVLSRFKDKKMMEEAGIPLSRWADGVLEAKENVAQSDTLKAVFFWGHAPNSQTRGPDLKKAFEKLDMLVVIDPHPTVSAVLHDRTDGVYLLPAATQYETTGSVTASNRSLQWREKVFGPFFEAKEDHEIMYLLAKKLGFEKEMFKNIKVEKNVPEPESITREFNKGMWTIGYTGQSPERLKLHMANQHTFDRVTLKANGGPCDGDYYGLPWPCWGTADIKHPGTPNLYDTSKPVSDGGLNFRVNFGLTVEGAGQRQVVEERSRRRQPARRRQLSASAPRSRTATRRCRWACCRRWAGTRTSPPRSLPSSTGSAAPSPRTCCGPSTCRAASSAWRSSTASRRSATARRAASSGTSPTACRCIASRSTRRAATCCRSMRPTRIASSTGCRCCSPRSRPRMSPRTIRSSSPRAVWSSTRAAARSSAPTRGSPSCSRTCSWRSTPTTPTTSASRTASRCGWRGPRRARSASWRW